MRKSAGVCVLLLALAPGCSEAPEPEAPTPPVTRVLARPEAPTQPVTRVLARLGDPELSASLPRPIKHKKLAGDSRPALCLGTFGGFDISTSPRTARRERVAGRIPAA